MVVSTFTGSDAVMLVQLTLGRQNKLRQSVSKVQSCLNSGGQGLNSELHKCLFRPIVKSLNPL